MRRRALSAELVTEVFEHVADLEESTSSSFGGGSSPLLVSVRSGAPISMPGMMDTVLNLGLNPQTAEALARVSGDRLFAADVMIRFHRMYAEIVLRADGDSVVEPAEEFAGHAGGDTASATFFEDLWSVMCNTEINEVGVSVPENPREQLEKAITAVFDSWNTRRANTYRRHNRISDSLGTAVVIQAMVFGNLGSPSGSGVVFTRNPTTGVPGLYGEYVEGGQGEEVVSGTRTPEPIAHAAHRIPGVFSELDRLASDLEKQRNDVLDIEFTVERGKLYFLQVRSAKRTASAAVRIASDFLKEGHMIPLDAISGVTAAQLREIERPCFGLDSVQQARASGRVLMKGIAASIGQAHGVAVLDPDRAEEIAAEGANVILLRSTTSPLDLHGMIASQGIVTARGGATSHAAVVARALGRPAVVGCSDLKVDAEARRFTIGMDEYREGVSLSIDGASGEIFEGVIPLTQSTEVTSDLGRVLSVARAAAPGCQVFGVCTTSEQVEGVRSRGAGGVAVRMFDLLVTNGLIEDFADELLQQRDRDRVDLSRFEPVMAQLLVPILIASENLPVAVRAVDLVDGDAADLIDIPALFAAYPGLGVPLGVPELLRAQIAGLALASGMSGRVSKAHLVARHIADPREIAELGGMAEQEMSRPGRGDLEVGALVTTSLGVQLAPELSLRSGSVWFDAQRLLANSSGYPASVFTGAEPLDEYMRRGMLSHDPRLGADDAQLQVFSSVNKIRVRAPQCRIGVRLSAPISAELVGAYYRSGVRMFATDPEEIRPTALVLGKEALDDAHKGRR